MNYERYKTLSVERSGRIATVTFRRPAKLNAVRAVSRNLLSAKKTGSGDPGDAARLAQLRNSVERLLAAELALELLAQPLVPVAAQDGGEVVVRAPVLGHLRIDHAGALVEDALRVAVGPDRAEHRGLRRGLVWERQPRRLERLEVPERHVLLVAGDDEVLPVG